MWDIFGIFLGYAWDMLGIFLGYVWDMLGIVLGYVWDMFGICLGYAWVFFYVWDILGICVGYSWDFVCIFLGYVFDIFGEARQAMRARQTRQSRPGHGRRVGGMGEWCMRVCACMRDLCKHSRFQIHATGILPFPLLVCRRAMAAAPAGVPGVVVVAPAAPVVLPVPGMAIAAGVPGAVVAAPAAPAVLPQAGVVPSGRKCMLLSAEGTPVPVSEAVVSPRVAPTIGGYFPPFSSDGALHTSKFIAVIRMPAVALENTTTKLCRARDGLCEALRDLGPLELCAGECAVTEPTIAAALAACGGPIDPTGEVVMTAYVGTKFRKRLPAGGGNAVTKTWVAGDGGSVYLFKIDGTGSFHHKAIAAALDFIQASGASVGNVGIGEAAVVNPPEAQAPATRSRLDVEIARAEAHLDLSAPDKAAFLKPANEHMLAWSVSTWEGTALQERMQAYWVTKHWNAAHPPAPRTIKIHRMFLPGCYLDAFTREIAERTPIARRLMIGIAPAGVAKTSMVEAWQAPEWWNERGLPDPRVLDVMCWTWKELGTVLDDHRVLTFQFEKGAFAALSDEKVKFIHRLTDTNIKVNIGKYRGKSLNMQQHVVIFANEMNPHVLENKEAWVVNLQEGAQNVPDTLWDFPAEPPSAKALVGRLGQCRKPRPTERDYEARLDIYTRWREESMEWTAADDIVPVGDQKRPRLRAAMDAMTPRTKGELDSFLRKAQNGGTTPLRDRQAATAGEAAQGS